MAKGVKTGGRTKGTPNKATADVKEAASAYTASAISTLAAIMQDTEEAAPARVAAARELLDRAHGKPKQSVEATGANGSPLIPAVKVEFVGPVS